MAKTSFVGVVTPPSSLSNTQRSDGERGREKNKIENHRSETRRMVALLGSEGEREEEDEDEDEDEA